MPNPKTLNRSWKRFGEESWPTIAIIATSNGYDYKNQRANDLTLRENFKDNAPIAKRILKLNGIKVAVAVPCYEYEEDRQKFVSIISEPEANAENYSQISDFASRVVSPKTGAKQIIECVKNGWDIFPLMGGDGFNQKLREVIDYFNVHPEHKPERPVNIYGYSDVTHASILQSHHPDIFRHCASPQTYNMFFDDVSREHKDLEGSHRDIIDRKKQSLLEMLERGGRVEKSHRKILFEPEGKKLTREDKISYYLFNTCVFGCAANDFYYKAGEERILHSKTLEGINEENHPPGLNTGSPYIISFEGFLQEPSSWKHYHSSFHQDFELFMKKAKERNELPVAVEISLIATRLDGNNGYTLFMHNEETGLIEESEFNVTRMYENEKNGKKITSQIQELLERKEGKIKDRYCIEGAVFTDFPEELIEKVKRGEKLEESDMIKIIKQENEKILKYREKVIEISRRYEVPVIANYTYGHTLNVSATSSGAVNFERSGENSLTFEHLGRDVELGKPKASVRGSGTGSERKLASASSAKGTRTTAL